MNKSFLIKKRYIVLIGIPLFYLLLLLSFYLFQERVIYQRTKLSEDYVYSFDQPTKEFFIKTSDGNTINGLLFKADAPSKGLVFYLHGNAGNLTRWGHYARDFTQLGYDVFMYDYRGYGKSAGIPNDQNMFEDAYFMLNWAGQYLPHSQLILYGRSLGTSLASALAIDNNPILLILETPFANFQDVIFWLFKPAFYIFPIKANFSNEAFLGKVKCRKIVFHGTADWVVPLSSAEKLKPLLSADDQFIVIEGAGHRNLNQFESYQTALAKALKSD